tara:strand:+ start:2845 stop:4035 length:1191 start_codon:yes stop_codon:yes gene_type:complete
MKDLLTKLANLDKDIQTINEQTDPLAETASMNISMAGDSADEVAQLLSIMRSGGELTTKAPEGPAMTSMPMNKALSIMDAPPADEMPSEGAYGENEGPCPECGEKKHILKACSSCGCSEGVEVDEWANDADPSYADHHTMTHDLSGGINRSKTMHEPAADGDNPLAVEASDEEAIEAIKNELYAALAEKKKPDFPDLDNDGDKEEPMSQAIAQRDGEDDDDEDTNEAMEEDEVQAILAKHPESASAMKQGADIMDHDDLYDDLYSYFVQSGDMPYGTQKARDGDPYEWVQDRLDSLGFTGGEDESSEVNSDTTYSISGKTSEADEELARIAKNAGQTQEEGMKDRDAYSADEKAKSKKDVTLPKAPWDKKDDDEDEKDEATLEHEETLRAIRAISF